MEERVEIPRNARELAQYLQEVLIRLEKDGKISQDLSGPSPKAGISSKKYSEKDSEIIIRKLEQKRATSQNS